MAAGSFGYTPGTGTTPDVNVTGQMAARFINTSGMTLYVTEIRLLGVVTAEPSGTFQCAIYSDNKVYPYELERTTDVLTSLTVGTNTFPFSGDPVVVGPGEAVWLAFRTSVSVLLDNITSSSLITLDSAFSGTTAFQTFWDSPSSTPFDAWYTPLQAHGTDIGPGDPTNLRSNLVQDDILSQGIPNLRSDYLEQDHLSEGYPNLRSNYLEQDHLSEGYPTIRSSFVVTEILHPVPPELSMSTDLFPGCQDSPVSLPGLTYSVYKRPTFMTNTHKSPAGTEVRNALQEYPRWEFEFTYEFLKDSNAADSSLKTLMGFFLSRQGAFDSFLYKDPDDYSVTNGVLGDTDGATTQFSFKRTMGGFAEKVGQVDTGQPITLYLTTDENGTIPASPGPYTITVANASAFVEDLGVTKGGLPMTKVTSGPIAGQYSVTSGGVYTFAAADDGDAVVIRYRYTVNPSLYTVTAPNLVVFTSAPADGGVLSADFEFSFACRFMEDMQDFEKFMDKLWTLQSCSFVSIIQ